MEVPFKDSIKYPAQVNTRTTKATQEKIALLKKMGVDVGELQRRAIDLAVDKALKELDQRAG